MSTTAVFTKRMELDSSSMINMTLSEEPSVGDGCALQNTSAGNGWDAIAFSAGPIEDANSCWKGLRFKVPAFFRFRQSISVGFTRAGAMRESREPVSFSFAVQIDRMSDCNVLSAMENGKVVSPEVVAWGSLKEAGNVIDLRLTDGDSPKMQIWLNDALKYTWENTPVEFPLCAKVLAGGAVGLAVEELCWITTRSPLQERAEQLEASLHEAHAALEEAKRAASAAAKEKEQMQAQWQQAQAAEKEKTAALSEVSGEKTRLEGQLEEEQAAAQALAVETARMEKESAEALQVVIADKSRVEGELQLEKTDKTWLEEEKEQLQAQLKEVQAQRKEEQAAANARANEQEKENQRLQAQLIAAERSRVEEQPQHLQQENRDLHDQMAQQQQRMQRMEEKLQAAERKAFKARLVTTAKQTAIIGVFLALAFNNFAQSVPGI